MACSRKWYATRASPLAASSSARSSQGDTHFMTSSSHGGDVMAGNSKWLP
jgi:hypothetical protein